MLAESFWTSSTAQYVLAGLVAVVAFLLAWFLLGTAARAKKDREVEARMRAVIQPGQQPSAATATGADARGRSGSERPPLLVGREKARPDAGRLVGLYGPWTSRAFSRTEGWPCGSSAARCASA